ncbi:MAG TPA: YgiT-type zinc finger protein [Chloroflexota bacterium]|nr:YgiT-type zinc finger protein [Chloroflexota bacterium]
MRCIVCGGDLTATRTDLPFKVTETAIVILKDLPVLACGRCPEYLIEDDVLSRVDAILSRLDSSTELAVIRYAA